MVKIENLLKEIKEHIRIVQRLGEMAQSTKEFAGSIFESLQLKIESFDDIINELNKEFQNLEGDFC